VSKVLYTTDGAVCYVPPAPEDAVETFIEQAAAEFRKAGPRMTMRGGFSIADLRKADVEFDDVTPPFPLERVKASAPERREIRVMGIKLGGAKWPSMKW
jgi:hypothetical protein